MFVFEVEGESFLFMNLGWLLVNIVLFGVFVNEGYSDDKWVIFRDIEKEFYIIFVCIFVLELLYFLEFLFWGFVICGFLFWVVIR